MPRQSGSRKRRTRGRRMAERKRARRLGAANEAKKAERLTRGYAPHILDREHRR